jgi:hypothetical protein
MKETRMPTAALHQNVNFAQRRLLTAVTIAAIAIAFIVVAGFQSTPTTLKTLTVFPGDTLWSIAAATNPNVDPRDIVDEIIHTNGLTTSVISPGQLLTVPVH